MITTFGSPVAAATDGTRMPSVATRTRAMAMAVLRNVDLRDRTWRGRPVQTRRGTDHAPSRGGAGRARPIRAGRGGRAAGGGGRGQVEGGGGRPRDPGRGGVSWGRAGGV